jgi:protein-S-isoprenylcysteine O-methyltransferase Ste14
MVNIEIIINAIVELCIFAVIAAVAADFAFFQEKNGQKAVKKSPVATFTMFCFFFLFYLIEKNGWGVARIGDYQVRSVMIALGLALMVTGAFVNIAGRFRLGGNWSDHIKIYLGHTLVSDGVYGAVRHPLYASLIWMFYGSALIYSNWLAFLANTLIFVPAMYFRARQEERMLVQEFFTYKDYQRKVGMFFPKIKLKFKFPKK